MKIVLVGLKINELKKNKSFDRIRWTGFDDYDEPCALAVRYHRNLMLITTLKQFQQYSLGNILQKVVTMSIIYAA